MNHSISKLIKIVEGKIEWWNAELLYWTEKSIDGVDKQISKWTGEITETDYTKEQSALCKEEMKKAIEKLEFYNDILEVLNDKAAESRNKDKGND